MLSVSILLLFVPFRFTENWLAHLQTHSKSLWYRWPKWSFETTTELKRDQQQQRVKVWVIYVMSLCNSSGRNSFVFSFVFSWSDLLSLLNIYSSTNPFRRRVMWRFGLEHYRLYLRDHYTVSSGKHMSQLMTRISNWWNSWILSQPRYEILCG